MENFDVMSVPKGALDIIKQLGDAGHDAYIVGGCVRDCALGKSPGDWDITTSATPDEMKVIFKGKHILPIGQLHGTLAIKLDGAFYEVTTFRIDGEYTDNRRPDSVSFTRNLQDDLARRDFTINAMAYNPTDGLTDLFDGMNDLRAGIVRCVGDARHRFDEDYLRIMRAYRFCAVLGFDMHEDTRSAALEGRADLQSIAPERVAVELQKIAKNILSLYS